MLIPLFFFSLTSGSDLPTFMVTRFLCSTLRNALLLCVIPYLLLCSQDFCVPRPTACSQVVSLHKTFSTIVRLVNVKYGVL
ncbi:unnamed protein product [Prunus armeniaca]